MLMSPDRKLLLITPMKCGSTTAEETLCPLGWRYIMGPHPWDRREIEKHTDCVPYLAADARKLLLVRNPLDRVASLFNHHVQYHGPLDFGRWLNVAFHSRYHAPVTQLYAKHDRVICIERFQADMRRVGVDIKDVHTANVSPVRHRVPLEFRKPIRRFYAADITAGGYA